MFKNLPRRTLLGSIGLAIVLIFVFGIDPIAIRQWLDSLGAFGAPTFVFVGVFLMSVCVPKTVMSVMAGALFGTWMGSGLMLVTAVLAAFSNYIIGRWCLSDSIAHRQRSSIVKAMIEMASDAGFIEHLMIRLSPVPTMIVSYLMGACRARITPYLLAAVVAMIPQFLFVHSGTAAAMMSGNVTSVARVSSIVIALCVAIVISIWIPREAARRLEEASNSAEDFQDAPTEVNVSSEGLSA